MTADQKKKPGEERPQEPMPSTGEGSDSALDVLRRKRRQTPPPDSTLPLTPAPKK
jgi:hypothetical protein